MGDLGYLDGREALCPARFCTARERESPTVPATLGASSCLKGRVLAVSTSLPPRRGNQKALRGEGQPHPGWQTRGAGIRNRGSNSGPGRLTKAMVRSMDIGLGSAYMEQVGSTKARDAGKGSTK